MKIYCNCCSKEIKKYISIDYKKGHLIDERFKGQEKKFCSTECVIKFIEGLNEEPKGNNNPKTTADYKIMACVKCNRRTPDSIITNYCDYWGNDIMRVKFIKNNICSIDCLRNYMSGYTEKTITVSKIKNESLKESSLKKFRLMIEYAVKQDQKLRPDKYKMRFEIKTNWKYSEFDYCSRQDISCELCPLFEEEKGCCNGFYKKLSESQSWGEWIKNMIEVVKYFKENA